MHRMILIIAAIITLSAGNVFSQDDSARYIFGIPVRSDDDTARSFPARDYVPPKKIKPVGVAALPAEVREALETEEQYTGWQDSTVYLDLNTGLYIVPIKHRTGVKIFGLNKKGEPVTYDEVSRE
jgi:hypothetical protein